MAEVLRFISSNGGGGGGGGREDKVHNEGLGEGSGGGEGLFVPPLLDRDSKTFGGGGGKSRKSHSSGVVDESESELCLSSKADDTSGRGGRGGVGSIIGAVGEQEAGLDDPYDSLVMSGGGGGMFLIESDVLEDRDVEEDDTEDRREDFLSGTFGFGLPAGDFALIREVTGVPAVGVLD